MSEPASREQIAALRRFGVEEAASTKLGRLWVRRLRDHGQELLRLYSTQPRVRETTELALTQASRLVESRDAEQPPVVDAEVVRTVEAALAALRDLGSPRMRGVTGEALTGLRAARGKSVREIFPPGRP